MLAPGAGCATSAWYCSLAMRAVSRGNRSDRARHRGRDKPGPIEAAPLARLTLGVYHRFYQRHKWLFRFSNVSPKGPAARTKGSIVTT
jgi:hypothetical protein